LPDRCVDCNIRPRLHHILSCYSETFAVKAPEGAKYQVTLRLCLACGTRFPDRVALREYLRTRLPAHAMRAVAAAAV
jgi:hypothetical protein